MAIHETQGRMAQEDHTMLRQVRIVVEADTPNEAIDWLNTYERALMVREAERYALGVLDWPDLENKLGRHLNEEVIDYDDAIPGYKGRRSVSYRRHDTRSVKRGERADSAFGHRLDADDET